MCAKNSDAAPEQASGSGRVNTMKFNIFINGQVRALGYFNISHLAAHQPERQGDIFDKMKSNNEKNIYSFCNNYSLGSVRMC